MSQRRLTVVQMVPSMDAGGVERGTLEVNEELIQHGHRSITISNGGRLVPQLTAIGGEHVQWDISRKSLLSLRWIWPLRKFLQQEKVDILHANSRVPAWIAWLAWRGLPVAARPRFITTAHGLYSVNRYSEVMTYGERVISVSEAVDDYLRTSYPRLDASRLRLIPRGIDPQEFPRGYQPTAEWLANWNHTFPQLAGRPVVSIVGRITRYKGHHEFLEVIDRLRKEIPELRALVVGAEDPNRRGYAAELRSEVQRRNLDDVVTFTGNRPDIREIYAISDVVMSMSSNPPEAFGLATAEALNIGTPVVGWDSGGTSELLRHIYPDGLVALGDIQTAVEKVRHVLSHGATLAGKHPYLKHQMLQTTMNLYEELAA